MNVNRTSLVIVPLVIALLGCKKLAKELKDREQSSTPNVEAPAVPTPAPVPSPTVAAANSKWKVFASTEGEFSVELPGTPTPSKNKTNTAVGPIDIHMFTVSGSDGSAWIANYSDYPAALAKLSKPETILQGSMNGAVEAVGGTIKTKEKITVDGFPGREFAASARQGLDYTGRIILADNRLYQLTLVYLPGTVSQADVRKFFDSLKITKKP